MPGPSTSTTSKPMQQTCGDNNSNNNNSEGCKDGQKKEKNDMQQPHLHMIN